MIIDAEIINQPISGNFREKIYDINSEWKSANWTWVKFTDKGLEEWCGSFRGAPKGVAVSFLNSTTLVLTSDFLYLLDNTSSDIIEFTDNFSFDQLTVTPKGVFLISDSYNIYKITDSIKKKKEIKSPIPMDWIRFNEWKGTKLEFQCDEFMAWDNHYVMEYESETDIISIKNKLE